MLELGRKGEVMFNRRLFCAVSAGLVTGSSRVSAARPDVTVSKSVPVGFDFTKEPLPHFRNGYVVAVDHSHTTVRVWDSRWTLVMDRRVEIPGAARTILRDVSALPSGRVVVLARAIRADGKVSSALAMLDQLGGIERVVATSPYEPQCIASAPGGEIWTIGWVHDGAGKELGEYAVLKRYDGLGKLAAELVPRSLFAPHGKAPAIGAALAVSADRAFVVSDEAGICVEVSLSGEILGRWPVERTRTPIRTGLTYSDSGSLFASFDDRQRFLCRFDRKSGGWEPISLGVVGEGQQWFHLMGSDSGRLVGRTKPASNMIWIEVEI